jgi:hypothetical protein
LQPTIKELNEFSDPGIEPRVRAALEFIWEFKSWIESPEAWEEDPRGNDYWPRLIDALESWERLR